MAVGSGSAAGRCSLQTRDSRPGALFAGQTVVVPEQERATRVYEVRSTDHLWDILRKFEMSAPALRRLNPGLDIFSLREGQEIVVLEYSPGRQMEGVYTMQAGRRCFRFASGFAFPRRKILRANQNLRPQDFTRGMRIALPAQS